MLSGDGDSDGDGDGEGDGDGDGDGDGEVDVDNYLGVARVLRVAWVGDNWPVATSCLEGGLSSLSLVSITST